MLQTQAGQNARVVYSGVSKTAEKATHRLPGKRVTDTTEPPPLPLGLGCKGLSRLYPWGWAARGFPAFTPGAGLCEGLSRPLQLRSTLLLIKVSHLKNAI